MPKEPIEVHKWHREADPYDLSPAQSSGTVLQAFRDHEALTDQHVIPEAFSNRVILGAAVLLLKAKAATFPKHFTPMS